MGTTYHDAPTVVCLTGSVFRKKLRILFINFYPWIHFPGLEPLELLKSSTALSHKCYEEQMDRTRTLWCHELLAEQDEENMLKQQNIREISALDKSKKRRIISFIVKKRSSRSRRRL